MRKSTADGAAAYLAPQALSAECPLKAIRGHNIVDPDVTVKTFRSLSPVPLKLTSTAYMKQSERLKDELRKAGMPE